MRCSYLRFPRWLLLLATATLLPFLSGCLSTPAKAPIPARAFQGRTRVACVGDSITFGAGLSDPRTQSYPAVLAELLGPAYEVRNFGVNGATMVKGGDLPYVETPAFKAAQEFLPEVVVIALGTNDSKPQNWRHQNEWERDTYWMVRAFMTLPSRPVVYVCAPPPVVRDQWGIREAVVAREIVPRLRAMSAREGWPYIPLHTALQRSRAHFPDGVHPDAAAAAEIARTVEAAFRGR
ncbi:MAG: hypothetical protein IT580_18640 [Verrucomicrobiales bacterium]|nr:hypothetical protein [Verrucomicrobiales bacterium]